jgi:predicted dinucleotide-binding enzyme
MQLQHPNNVGIIGAGHIGGALARRLTATGHDVTVANSRGPESLRAFEQETGARAVTLAELIRESAIVVIAIPTNRVAELPKNIFAGASGLIVVDTGNYYPRERDGRIGAIEDGLTESAWVAQQISHPVIKAFNTIRAEHIVDRAKPAGTPGRVALAVAGDDEREKRTVMDLIDAIGFDGVDAGTIAESWRQQPGSPGYLQDYDRDGVVRSLREATPERTEQWRATPNSPGTYEQPA